MLFVCFVGFLSNMQCTDKAASKTANHVVVVLSANDILAFRCTVLY